MDLLNLIFKGNPGTLHIKVCLLNKPSHRKQGWKARLVERFKKEKLGLKGLYT